MILIRGGSRHLRELIVTTVVSYLTFVGGHTRFSDMKLSSGFIFRCDRRKSQREQAVAILLMGPESIKQGYNEQLDILALRGEELHMVCSDPCCAIISKESKQYNLRETLRKSITSSAATIHCRRIANND